MHKMFASHMFLDVMSACGLAGRSSFVCYVSNARSGAPFTGTLTLTAIDLQSGASSVWATLPMAAPPGPGALAWGTPNATLPNATTTLLVARLQEEGAATPFDDHVVHLTAPLNLAVRRAAVAAAPAAQANADGSIDILLTSDAVAIFVTLTCAAPGRFSDNAFYLLPSAPRTVQWLPFEPGDPAANLALLTQTLRVEDHSAYAVTR